MKSTNYRENIEKDFMGVWTVVGKTDIETGLPVCCICDTIITEEEDLENDGICDLCDAQLKLDDMVTVEHPDNKHTFMGV